MSVCTIALSAHVSHIQHGCILMDGMLEYPPTLPPPAFAHTAQVLEYYCKLFRLVWLQTMLLLLMLLMLLLGGPHKLHKPTCHSCSTASVQYLIRIADTTTQLGDEDATTTTLAKHLLCKQLLQIHTMTMPLSACCRPALCELCVVCMRQPNAKARAHKHTTFSI